MTDKGEFTFEEEETARILVEYEESLFRCAAALRRLKMGRKEKIEIRNKLEDAFYLGRKYGKV